MDHQTISSPLTLNLRAGTFGRDKNHFQRPSFGSHAKKCNLSSPAFGDCALAKRHSAVQRIPRSHSSASLRSRSTLALSPEARANLRYRLARALLTNPDLNATEQRHCSQSV